MATLTASSTSRPVWWQRAALPFAVALLLAAVTHAALPFDGLYGQDAFAYFRFARAILPHLVSGAPLPDLFWPRGYPAAVAALLPLTGGSPVAGQIVSALACAWAAAATSLLVRALERGHAGRGAAALVAGLAVATSGAVLRSSQVVMADGLALGLAATAILCAVRFGIDRRGPWLVACAAALTWGAVTRWLVGLLALPIALYWLLALRTGVRGPAAQAPAPPRAAQRLSPWVAAAAVVALAVLVPQLMTAHAIPKSLQQHEWLERWNPMNAIARDFQTREGPAHYKLPVGLFYAARLAWPDYLFPGVALFALVGLWSLVRERRWPAVTLLAGWPLVVWLFISGIPYTNPRFLLPTLPAVGALIGIGFAQLAGGASRRRRVVLGALVAASVAAGLVFAVREHARTVVARKNAGLEAVAWLARQVPAEATVLMPGGTLIFEHYSRTKVRDTFLLTSAELTALMARGGPYYYCEDGAEIAARWAGLSPALHQRELRARGLVAVAQHPPYALFRVADTRR